MPLPLLLRIPDRAENVPGSPGFTKNAGKPFTRRNLQKKAADKNRANGSRTVAAVRITNRFDKPDL